MRPNDLKPGQQFTLTGIFTASADPSPSNGIKLTDSTGNHCVSAVLDEILTMGYGKALLAPSLDLTDEQGYQHDAARSMTTAANSLRQVADRIGHLASLLASGSVNDRRAFPNTGMVRDALNEFRITETAIRLDSALESALLADQARAAAEAQTAPLQG